MDYMKQQSGGSSSSSFTETLFGPKDACTSSSGLFGSVFGPPSTGLGKESYNFKYTGSLNKQDFGNPKLSKTGCYKVPKDGKTQRSKSEKGRHPFYQTETAESNYFSSSIYYGGQEVYPPTSTNNCSQSIFHRGGGDEDSNGISASRGNWWQGSLYY